jgi:tape measure domain-containing protein
MEDRFSAAFTSYITMGNRAAGATQLAQSSARNYQTVLAGLDRQIISLNGEFAAGAQRQAEMVSAGMENTRQFAQLDGRMERLGDTIRGLEAQYRAVSGDAERAARSSKAFAQELQSTDRQADRLTSTITRLAGAYLSLRGLGQLAGLSDAMSQTEARLDRMNDGLQTTAQLQDMIAQSALRSRGIYADTADFVAKLGTLAPEAFSSNGELIAFAEQINKQMVLSGTSAAGAQGAMLQLTQALSSGVLRGEELNSVLEQTPMIAQTIAGYMGVTTGQLRELASEGAITAEVVKNAMLDAAEETDAAFARMPLTWGQVWNQAQTIMLQTFQPALEFVGAAAGFVGEHMETIIPIFYGLAAAVGVYTAAMVVKNAVEWAGVAANQALIASMLSNPFLWAAVAVGILVAALYQWAQSVGGVEIAWLILVDGVLSGWDVLKYGFFAGVYFVMDKWDLLGLKVQEGGVFIQNSIGNMKVGVLTLLQEMANGGIDIINGFIEKLNLLPGVSIQALEHTTFAAAASVEHEAAKAARAASLADARAEMEARQSQRAQLQTDRWTQMQSNHFARQDEIARKQAEASQPSGSQWENPSIPSYGDLGGISSQLDSIGGDTGALRREVALEREDIKSLVDIAERRYVNNINLTAQTPIINIHGQNTGDTAADRQALANTVRDILLEQAAAGSVLTTARAF